MFKVQAGQSIIFIVINGPVTRGKVCEPAIVKANINIPRISEAYSQQLSYAAPLRSPFGLKGGYRHTVSRSYAVFVIQCFAVVRCSEGEKYAACAGWRHNTR